MNAAVITSGNPKEARTSALYQEVLCLGRDKHAKPVVTEEGWAPPYIRQVTHYYPETDTTNKFLEFVGDPLDKFGVLTALRMLKKKAPKMNLHVPT